VDVLDYLKQSVNTCTAILKWGANMQGSTRKSLVVDLQSICSNCEDAYGAILERLVPVKNAFADPTTLARELRKFTADQTLRRQFKPNHLCGNIDQLLQRLANNLDPLKYSIDLRQIGELRNRFEAYGNYDLRISESYDEFTVQLDLVANQIGNPTLSARRQGRADPFDPRERAQYAEHVIEDFQTELRSALDTVRKAKADLIKII
jgi:hypothetical protein